MNSTKRESNTALYAVSEYAEFSSLLALAKAVRAELGLHPVFVFKHDYGALELHAKQLDALHFSWASAKQASLHTNYSASGDEDDYVPTYVRLPKVASSVRERSRTAATLRWAATIGGIAATPIVVLGAIPALFFRGARTRSLLPMLKRLGRMHPGIVKMRYHKLLAEMRKVFDLFRPSIVISGQDYSLSITAMASLVAEERGIRTAIVPFSMTPTTKELAESFSGTRTNLLRGRLRSNLIRKVFPQWINHYQGRDYTRLTLPEILVAEEMRLAAPIPWMPNSGRGVLLLPGQQSLQYCAAAGIPLGQLRATGAQWSDQLWGLKTTRGRRRADLIDDIDSFSATSPTRNRLASTSFTDRTKLLLVSWPPDQTPRSPTGLNDFNDLCGALIETLSRIHYGGTARVAVSLHPTLVGRPLHAELKREGIYVLDRQLVEVLDCADIFLATVSSTLLWSLQLEIPSVNFDVYRYGYREFSEAGIIDVSSVPDLRATLLSLIRQPDHYASVQEALRVSRGHWGMFDGSCTKRIMDELSALMPQPVTGKVDSDVGHQVPSD